MRWGVGRGISAVLSRDDRLIGNPGAGDIEIVPKAFEEGIDLGMRDRIRILFRNQILLRDIGDIGTLRIFREQVIVRLFLARAILDRDRLPPFFGVGEFRIHIEYHAPERMHPVLDDLAYLKFSGSNVHGSVVITC